MTISSFFVGAALLKNSSAAVELRIYGAQGGNIDDAGIPYYGGLGGYTNWQGTIRSTTVFTVYVGGQGVFRFTCTSMVFYC